MPRLESLVCIVTGAGSGQGRAVATAFASEGANVLACDIQEAGVESAAAEARALGQSMTALVHDVASADDWSRVVATARELHGGVDVLYNNAGVLDAADGGVLDTTGDVWDRVMTINTKSVFLGAGHVVPSMRERGSGSIINVASIRAYLGATLAKDAYAASKAAIIGLTKSLAVELGPDAIRCNVVCPGTIETPMISDMGDEWRRPRLDRYPLGRFGQPGDVAGLAVFLASAESSWITGTSINIDGGASAKYV